MKKAKRIVIIGNSGSGKSWLSGIVAQKLGLNSIGLDEIHWLPGGFNQRRHYEEAKSLVRIAAKEDSWVIEGVFGWLASEAIPRADHLIWLDMPIEECVSNLQNRPIKSGEDDASKASLIQWCRDYKGRDNSNSFSGHRAIFESFSGNKTLLKNREDISHLINAII